jgi:hypothetical protein
MQLVMHILRGLQADLLQTFELDLNPALSLEDMAGKKPYKD